MQKTVPGPCPSCSKEIEYRYQTEDIPYFSDILIISANCPHCGYRYVDTQILKSAEPSKHTLIVTRVEDLAARVIRSMTASIAIPELGVEIDPGPACAGFVTNVEGVLDRIEQVVIGAEREGDQIQKENARALLNKITQAREGKIPLTIIVSDPSGNSAIVSEKAEKTTLEVSTDSC